MTSRGSVLDKANLERLETLWIRCEIRAIVLVYVYKIFPPNLSLFRLQVLENPSTNKPEVERRKGASFDHFPRKLQNEGEPITLQDADDLTSLNLVNEDTGLNPSSPNYLYITSLLI